MSCGTGNEISNNATRVGDPRNFDDLILLDC